MKYVCFNLILGTRELLAKPGQSKDDIGFFKTMVAGAVGGLVLWTIIFPSDVIKSRVQISNKSQKFLTVGLEIIRNEGLYNDIVIYIFLYFQTNTLIIRILCGINFIYALSYIK